MRAMYSFKQAATKAEIAAKARFDELSTEMLDFLVQKGVLEQIDTDAENGNRYRLTIAGSGCLLHLTPTLG